MSLKLGGRNKGARVADALCVSKYSISSAVSRDTCLPALSGWLSQTHTDTHTHTQTSWTKAERPLNLPLSFPPSKTLSQATQGTNFYRLQAESCLIHFLFPNRGHVGFAPLLQTRLWHSTMEGSYGGLTSVCFSSSLLCRAAVCGQQSVGRMALEESQPSLTHPHAAALTRKNSSQVM